MSQAEDANAHDLLVAKGAAMACLFCATVLFGCIPFMLNCCLKWTEKSPNSRSANVVQYLLYFGGGVLLATTFIHLLPEVIKVVQHLQVCGQMAKTPFGVAEVLMCAGFFLMYLIEECVHKFLHRHENAKEEPENDEAAAAFERGHSVRNSILVKGRKRSDDYVPEDNVTGTIKTDQNGSFENPNYLSSTLTVDHLIDPACSKHSDLQLQIEDKRRSSACSTPKHHHEHNHVQDHEQGGGHGHEHGGHGHGHSHLPLEQNDTDNVVSSSLRGLGIVLALSLHEVFEGLAIGLEDSPSSVWFLFAAVSAHKLVLAFCVGVELIVARTKPILATVYTITFAIVSPIGVAIGIAISHDSSSSEDSIPSAVLQGIACGTLLYVVFFEILSKHHAGLGAFLAMLIGFCLMFGLQNIGEGPDDDDTCPGAVNIEATTTTLLDLTTTKLIG